MYYLSEFSETGQQYHKSSWMGNLFKKGTKIAGNTIKNTPFISQQLGDLGREKVLAPLMKAQKPTLRQKVKLTKAYLKYRKHLGDTYGKEEGLKMLNNQKTYVTNLFKPSYKKLPIEE